MTALGKEIAMTRTIFLLLMAVGGLCTGCASTSSRESGPVSFVPFFGTIELASGYRTTGKIRRRDDGDGCEIWKGKWSPCPEGEVVSVRRCRVTDEHLLPLLSRGLTPAKGPEDEWKLLEACFHSSAMGRGAEILGSNTLSASLIISSARELAPFSLDMSDSDEGSVAISMSEKRFLKSSDIAQLEWDYDVNGNIEGSFLIDRRPHFTAKCLFSIHLLHASRRGLTARLNELVLANRFSDDIRYGKVVHSSERGYLIPCEEVGE
jgi:hypothetical protein